MSKKHISVCCCLRSNMGRLHCIMKWRVRNVIMLLCTALGLVLLHCVVDQLDSTSLTTEHETQQKLDLQEFTSRMDRIKQQCSQASGAVDTNTKTKVIMTNWKHRLAYCYIPKCGCTFWKRVIRFLNDDYNKTSHITNPFQISRYEVHYSLPGNPDTNVLYQDFSKRAEMYNRFMFVRNPYSRLWSAYIDKFFLPDFWRFHEKELQERRQHFSCIKDVSFHEFIDFTLSPSGDHDHWDPMHEVCNPCQFKPMFVGKLESFMSDTRTLLEKTNLSWIMKGYDHHRHVEEEIRTLITYNVGLLKFPRVSDCISRFQIYNRLWKSFQIMGFLPDELNGSSVHEGLTTKEFTDMVLRAYRKEPNTPDSWREQRRRHMIEAYKTVPSHLIELIKQKYSSDFKLFGYATNIE